MAKLKQHLHNRTMLLVHAPKYAVYSILISWGGLSFGLDTGTIGPITTMPQFYRFFGELSPLVHGLVVSSILIPAAVASFFAGHLSDAVGRPRTVGLGLLIFSIGCALQASSQNLGMLFAGRIITGGGEGIYMSAMTVYICEIAPPKLRGMLCSIQQFLLSFGICIGYFICYGSVRTDETLSLAWRLPFAIQSFLALLFCALAFPLPHSPRWLEVKGRRDEADALWEKLGISAAELERDVEEETPEEATLREALALSPAPPVQAPVARKTNGLAIFHRSVIFRTFLGAALMIFQQLSGIDGVLYYAPLLFQAAGLTSATSSFLASGLSALLMFLITIPAFWYADRWGRRTSVLTGGYIIACSMLLIGILYASNSVHGDYGAARWIVIALIYIFALTFSCTWAVTIRVYASEIQPLHTRAPATSLAQSMNWVTNWIVAFITPILLSKATYSIYFLFGGSTAIAVVFLTYAMPETKGRSLEAIDREFERRRATKSLNVTGLTRRLARRRQNSDDGIEMIAVTPVK